jgi:glucose/arabinose dehydrogenase
MPNPVRGNRLRWPARLLAGIGAGLWGSLAAVLLFWGAWMLPVLGLVVTRATLGAGAVTVVLLGVAGGAAYGLVTGTRGLSPLTSAVSGALLGLLMWGGGALVAIPRVLGLSVLPVDPRSQLPSLGAFLAYGVSAALAYEFLAGRLLGVGAGTGPHVSAGARCQRRIARHRWSAVALALTIPALSAVVAALLLRGAWSTDLAALAVAPGFRAEVVAKGFTFPTSLAWGPGGALYVGESGYSYGPKVAVARVVSVGPDGSVREVARGFDGPLNGLAYHNGNLYVSHRGRVTVLDPDDGAQAARRDLVTGLPSLGDHHNNELAVGPDGFLYVGQGTATNAGVVGSDNFLYGWADRYPWFGDVPSRQWTLHGRAYRDVDLRTANPLDSATTGAFAPFGQSLPGPAAPAPAAGQAASGAVLRIDPGSGALTVYADGLRNPYGLAFGPQGQLYATNLGYDDRGVRAVRQSPDWVVAVEQGAWYGWPDFAGTVPLADERFRSRRGVDRQPLIANPPPVAAPLATLMPHVNPMKLAVSPGGAFGEAGALFVAAFGDVGPLTEDLTTAVPTGVLRINPADGRHEWFLLNRQESRAERWGNGIKRAIAVLFTPDRSAMYVLDFGQLEVTDLAPNAILGTGVLWRIVPDVGK